MNERIVKHIDEYLTHSIDLERKLEELPPDDLNALQEHYEHVLWLFRENASFFEQSETDLEAFIERWRAAIRMAKAAQEITGRHLERLRARLQIQVH